MMRMLKGGIGVSVLIAALLLEATVCFLPLHCTFSRLRPLWAKNATATNIHYSANFHRHVVCEKQAVKESFLWLDEAIASYPNARFSPLQTSASLKIHDTNAEGWKAASTRTRSREVVELLDDQVLRKLQSVKAVASDLGVSVVKIYDVIRNERVFRGKSYAYASIAATNVSFTPLIVGGGLEEDVAYNLTTLPSSSYFSISSIDEGTLRKYKSVIETLDSKLPSPFFSYFPEADHIWIQERIFFLLAPQSNSFEQEDWVRAFHVDGKGVGMTETQAVTAILALRHLLQLYPNDSSSGKPSLPYFHRQLKITLDMMDEARVSWDQCRIILESLSFSLISCELETGWEFMTASTPVRSQLNEESLHYLRMRLCLSPDDIIGMLKSHSRLSSYSRENLKLHIDALQSMLHLSSRDLSRLVRKAPSILGVSILKLDQRISFLSDEVDMTSAQIWKLVLRFPSVLQYNVERNLHPKINYFKGYLGLSSAHLNKIVSSTPSLLGRSLNETIVPLVDHLCEDACLSPSDVRSMVIQVPQILISNWETNLKQKMRYLKTRLGLSNKSLGTFLARHPRIFVHSIANSLEPNLQSLERFSGDSKSAIEVVISNPSLLLVNRAQLDRKLDRLDQSNMSLDSFSKQKRKKKVVLELVDGEVVRTLASVEATALDLGTSKHNLYSIIRTKRLFNGKNYEYGDYPENNMIDRKQVSSVSLRKSKGTKRKKNSIQDGRMTYVPNDSPLRLVELLRSPSALTAASCADLKPGENQDYLAIFVCSRVFPPKQASGSLGKRKAGGHSIYVPQLKGLHTGGKLLRTAAERCFSNLYPAENGGTSFVDGVMLLRYPYLRPSRNRCSLYVCRDALRFASELLLVNRDSEFKESSIHIDIFTDSNYAWELLNNSTNLLRWGSYERKDDFMYDGDAPEWTANVDILYPLSRTYYRLAKQDLISAKRDIGRVSTPIAKQVRVQFRHQAEVGWFQEDSMLQTLGSHAERAASWQYESLTKLPTT
eukprot:scaffold463_cov92-Cylindrotheca_fusiformis.AAC.6